MMTEEIPYPAGMANGMECDTVNKPTKICLEKYMVLLKAGPVPE
jgi:hypothetical protein